MLRILKHKGADTSDWLLFSNFNGNQVAKMFHFYCEIWEFSVFLFTRQLLHTIWLKKKFQVPISLIIHVFMLRYISKHAYRLDISFFKGEENNYKWNIS